MRGVRGGYAKREHRPIPEEGPYRSFVGNLPADTIQGDFDTLFSGLKINTVHMIRDKETDRFKGFAYVEFSTREELEKALEIDGAEFDGRFVRVDVADNRDNRDNRPKQRNNRSPRGGRRRRGSDNRGSDRPHRPVEHKARGDHKGNDFHRPKEDHREQRTSESGGADRNSGASGDERSGDNFQVVRNRKTRGGGTRGDRDGGHDIRSDRGGPRHRGGKRGGDRPRGGGQPSESSAPPAPDPNRPRLNLQPRTTDPEELERRRRKDEEERKARLEKICTAK